MAAIVVNSKEMYRHQAAAKLWGKYEFDKTATNLEYFGSVVNSNPAPSGSFTVSTSGKSVFFLRTQMQTTYRSCCFPLLIQVLMYLGNCMTCFCCCCRYSNRCKDEGVLKVSSLDAPLIKETGDSKDYTSDGSFGDQEEVGDSDWELNRWRAVGRNPWFYSLRALKVKPFAYWCALCCGREMEARPSLNRMVTGEPHVPNGSVRCCDQLPSLVEFGQDMACIPCIKQCGTPAAVTACRRSIVAWMVAIFFGPFMIAISLLLGGIFTVTDFLLIPLMLVVLTILACILLEPCFLLVSLCCGMKSTRPGFTVTSSLVRYYSFSGIVNGNNKDYSEYKVIGSVILVENANLFRTLWMLSTQTNPSMSFQQLLVRNPLWGLFESNIPTKSISKAWDELIQRCGGIRPSFVPENTLWDIV